MKSSWKNRYFEFTFAGLGVVASVVSYFMNEWRMLSIFLAVLCFGVALILIKIESIMDSSLNMQSLVSTQNGISVTMNSKKGLKTVTAKLHEADGIVKVFGRGPSYLDELNLFYMKSVEAFLSSSTSNKYYRLLVTHSGAEVSTYIWLRFAKRLLDRFPDQVKVHLLELNAELEIITPFQVIGESFVHYVHGYFTRNPNDGQAMDAISTFYEQPEYAKYFSSFFDFHLWNKRDVAVVSVDNVDDRIVTYRGKCPEELWGRIDDLMGSVPA